MATEFYRDWFQVVDAPVAPGVPQAFYVDRGAAGDYTVRVTMSVMPDGKVVVSDIRIER